MILDHEMILLLESDTRNYRKKLNINAKWKIISLNCG